jgi:hypothetical protein
MSNVVALRGGPVPEANVPNASAIEILEKLLERARSGDIQSVICAYAFSDGCADYCGTWPAFQLTLIGTLEVAKTRMLDAVMRAEEANNAG